MSITTGSRPFGRKKKSGFSFAEKEKKEKGGESSLTIPREKRRYLTGRGTRERKEKSGSFAGRKRKGTSYLQIAGVLGNPARKGEGGLPCSPEGKKGGIGRVACPHDLKQGPPGTRLDQRKKKKKTSPFSGKGKRKT